MTNPCVVVAWRGELDSFALWTAHVASMDDVYRLLLTIESDRNIGRVSVSRGTFERQWTRDEVGEWRAL